MGSYQISDESTRFELNHRSVRSVLAHPVVIVHRRPVLHYEFVEFRTWMDVVFFHEAFVPV